MLALPSSECKGNEVNESWKCMCASATTKNALCSPSFSQKSFCLFVATRVCVLALPPRCYRAGHVINLILTGTGNTLASVEKRPFSVYRRCGDVGG